MQILSEKVVIRCKDGKFRRCEAYLVKEKGGKTVIYINQKGEEVHREALSKSQFKNIDIETIDKLDIK